MLMTKADNPWVFSKTFDIVQIENLNFWRNKFLSTIDN
jgi:hypothetical protein